MQACPTSRTHQPCYHSSAAIAVPSLSRSAVADRSVSGGWLVELWTAASMRQCVCRRRCCSLCSPLLLVVLLLLLCLGVLNERRLVRLTAAAAVQSEEGIHHLSLVAYQHFVL